MSVHGASVLAADLHLSPLESSWLARATLTVVWIPEQGGYSYELARMCLALVDMGSPWLGSPLTGFGSTT